MIGYHRNDSNQHLPRLIVIGVSMILSKFCAPWKVIPSLFFDAMQRYHNFHKSNLDPMLHHIFWITSYFAKHLRFVPEPDVFVQIAKCICPSYKSISCTRFSESHHILQNTEAEYSKPSRFYFPTSTTSRCHLNQITKSVAKAFNIPRRDFWSLWARYEQMMYNTLEANAVVQIRKCLCSLFTLEKVFLSKEP